MHFRVASGLVISTALVLSGCSASSKTFYASPAKVKDTQLCRTVLEAIKNGNRQFALDTYAEAERRGMTLEECQKRVSTEDAVLLAALVVGTVAGVAAICSSTSCAGGGGGGYAPRYRYDDYDCAGGTGDGPNYVRGPVRVSWDDPYELDRDGDLIGCELGDDWGA